MKAPMRYLLLIALAAGVVAFLTSSRGRRTRERLAGYATEAAELTGGLSFDRAVPNIHLSSSHVDDEALRGKIEETRRRLQEQLDAGLSHGSSAAA